MNLKQIDWMSIGVESLVGGLFEGLLLLFIGSWVLWRARRDLKAGRFNDMVLFSFNMVIEREGEAPLLGFRTPLNGTLDEIFLSAPLIKEIKAQARRVSDDEPIIKLRDPKLHSALQRQLINFCNQLNRDGQMAALTGQPYQELEYQLALVYEPGAQAKMFRVIPVSDPLLEQLEQLKGELIFTHSYHADRLKALRAIATQRQIDKLLPIEERTLTGFMISAPLYERSAAQPSAAAR